MADSSTPGAGNESAPSQDTGTPDTQAIEAARERFLAGAKKNAPGKGNKAARGDAVKGDAAAKGRSRPPRRVRKTAGPSKTAPVVTEPSAKPAPPQQQQQQQQQPRPSGIASRSAGEGRQFVGAMADVSADLATERGYLSWAEMDMEEFRTLSDQAQAVARQHIVANAQDPRYAAALREVDAQFAYAYLGAAPAPVDIPGTDVRRDIEDTSVAPVADAAPEQLDLLEAQSREAAARDQGNAAGEANDVPDNPTEPGRVGDVDGVDHVDRVDRVDADTLLRLARKLRVERGAGLSDADWDQMANAAERAMRESHTDGADAAQPEQAEAAALQKTALRNAAIRLAGQMGHTILDTGDSSRPNPFVDETLRYALDDRIAVVLAVNTADAPYDLPLVWPERDARTDAVRCARQAAMCLAENPPDHELAVDLLREAVRFEKSQRAPEPGLFPEALEKLERYVARYAPAYVLAYEQNARERAAREHDRPARTSVSPADAPAEAENGIEAVAGIRVDTPSPATSPAPRFTARLREVIGRAFGREAVQPARNEPGTGEMRAPAVLTKDGYAIPEAIAARYVVRDGNFWRFEGQDPGKAGDHEPHFTDHGARLATPGDDRQTIADMITVAQAKGWGEVALKGSDAFRRNAWIEASLAGLKTRGFTPDEQDHAMLEAARRERASLTIRAGTRARVADVAPAAPATPGVSPATSPAVTSAASPADATSSTPPAKTAAPATASPVDVTDKAGPQRADSTTPVSSPATVVATAADVAPAVDATPPQAGPKILIAHGEAPYLHDRTNSDSYFVTTRDSSGAEKTVWGIDLPRALDEYGAQVGDQVSLANLGKRWVTVNAPVKDKAGNVTGYEEKEVHRNTWEVKIEVPAVRTPTVDAAKAEPPAKTVGELRREVETAIAALPENVRRVVMDRFAEHMAAGLEVQTEVAGAHATAQARVAALGPAIEARLDQVDRERVARETQPVVRPESTREAPRHKTPKPSHQGER